MKYVIAGLILLALVMAFVLGSHDSREHNERADQLAAQNEILKADNARLSVENAKRDTVWRIAKARVDTLRDSILYQLHDTVAVIRYVARTDSALKACSDLSNSCERFRLHTDTLVRSLEIERTWWKAEYERQAKRRDLASRFFFPALIGGVVAGAWIRGR